MSSQIAKADSRHWRKDIQGLRGLAVLSVVVYHAGVFLPGGYLGVDIFFVISGFVITALLLREYESTGTISLSGFYRRRIKRLLPALLLLVAITVPVGTFILSPYGASQNAIWTAMASIFGLGNLAIQYLSGGYFGDDASVNSFLHTWSLAVEEQFYLVFPSLFLLSLLIWRRVGSRRVLVSLVVLVSALSAGLLMAASALDLPLESLGIFGFYSPLVRAWEFGLGAIVALIGNELSKRVAAASRLAGWGLVLTALFVPIDQNAIGIGALMATVGATLLILAGKTSHDRFLESKTMVYLGDVSYSWYLWHWPLIVFSQVLFESYLVTVAVAAASLVPAALSYRYIETPLRKMPWRIKQGGKFAASLGLTAVVTITSSGTLVNQGFFNEDLRERQAQILADHAPAQKNWICALGTLTSETVETCTWRHEGNGPTLYLVGDSQAGMFAEAVLGAGQALGSDVVISTTAGCPLLIQEAESDACAEFTSRTLELLSQSEAGVIFFSFALSPSQQDVQAIAFEISSWVKILTSLGHNLVQIGPIPHFTEEYAFNPLKCSLMGALNNNCLEEMPLVEAKRRIAVVSAVTTEVKKVAELQSIDPLGLACRDETCATSWEGMMIYKDPSHITVAAAEMLVDEIFNLVNSK